MSCFPKCTTCNYSLKYQGRQPCLLPCLHAVCKQCEERTCTVTKIKCNVCNIYFSIRDCKIPVDTVRAKEIFHLTVQHGSLKLLCTNKEDGNQAAVWCQGCETLMCENCRDVHNGIKAIRDHFVQELSKLTSQDIKNVDIFCPFHRKNIADEYDDTCKQLICSKCRKSPQHKGHTIEDVETYMASVKQELQTKYAALSDHKNNLAKDFQLTLQKQVEGLKGSADTVGLEISQIFSEIDNLLVQRFNELPMDLLPSLVRVSQSIQAQVLSARQVQRRIQSVLDYIQLTLQYGTESDLIVYNQIIQSASDVCLKLQALPVVQNQSIPCPTRCIGNILRDAISSFHNFVEVAKSTSNVALAEGNTTVPTTTADSKTETLIAELEQTVTLTEEVMMHMERENQKFQQLKAHLESGEDKILHILAKEDSSGFTVVMNCPKLEFGKEYVNQSCASIINENLVNWSKSMPGKSLGLQQYRGTCASRPLTLLHSTFCTDFPAIFYFEVQGKILILKRIPDQWYINLQILEIGFCDVDQRDKNSVVCGQSGSWGLCIAFCRKDRSICTQIWNGEKKVKCQLDTVSCTAVREQFEVTYGIVIDAARGRVAFLDLQSRQILHEMELEIQNTVWPMFGVAHHSECMSVQMSLVSENCVSMDQDKRELILKSMNLTI